MIKSKKSLTAVPKNALPSDMGKHITKFEYICLMFARVGGMFGTTLTGTLATSFLHELYYGPAGVEAEEIADILFIQTILTTVCGVIFGLVSGVVVQKWRTRWGRYRQWYIICLIPMFALTVFYFYVPEGMSVTGLILLRYTVACCQTVFNLFNNLGQNVAQVISPNHKEKKSVATLWQLSYYIGYGGAYIAQFIYGEISDDKNAMYIDLAVIAACVTFVGNLMCGLFCKERIELPTAKKVKVSKTLFSLFKYKNYRAYQLMQWANVLAMLGKMSTYLVAITVGSSKNLLLTIPTAAGTVIGNVITAKLVKKFEATKLLKFCGVYSMASALILFIICYVEAEMGLRFFSGWNSIFFYVFYFLFGIGIGIQELSNSHFNVEYYDYLEWQTGERIEAIQGIIPGWIQTALSTARDILIPYMIAWVGYESSDEKNLLITMQAKPDYMKTCLWLLAFMLFGYALSNAIKAIVIKTMYDVEGERKEQMYRELEIIRAKRHEENLSLAEAE